MQEEIPFLRSINIVFDASEPERIAHYEPTSKAIAFLRGVSGQSEQRAFFVIAPYGSGKSVSATYLLQLIENRDEATSILKPIAQRLKRVDPALGSFAEARAADRKTQGVVLALEGAIHDIGTAVCNAARASVQRLGLHKEARALEQLDARGIGGALRVLDHLKETSKPARGAARRLDRIVILWDEFGRHVEQLIRSGHPQRLAEIQTLAEYAARAQALPITFGLLMHQGLLQYATGLSQSMLAEWRKVEGRFDPIQYVDDSRELYRLIGKIVKAHRSLEDLPLGHPDLSNRTLEAGLLSDLEDELPQLLQDAHPVEPAALHILPRLAARAAQHERTLFGFLLSRKLADAVTPAHLYDYFAPAMQADTGVGGTYRKWLETESALSKVDDELEAAAIKTASILELGLSGERSRVSRALLEFALGDNEAARHAIDRLLERKLLLHRRRSNQLSLWHGTDVDLRSRLEEELARLEGDFDVLALLNKEFRPPAWRPVRYNDTFRIRRYFDCEFVSGEALRNEAGIPLTEDSRADGRILYVVPQNESDCTNAHAAALTYRDRLTVIAVPSEMLDIRAAAAELLCLTRMQHDEALLAEDPLIATELQQMLDETQVHLHNQLSRLTQPGPEMRWYAGGRELPVSDRAALLSALSSLCEEVFSRTPVINNEMIVRHKPSPQLVNARRKVVLGILERHGRDRLGIAGEFADASVFRTVLVNTGLYRELAEGEGFGYAQPDELKDPAFAEVWHKFKDLLTLPDDRPKDLPAFFSELAAPPYGIRDGVMPILFAAALRAFPSALAVSDASGNYLEDILPSHIESICQRPDAFTLTVIKLDPATERYLHQLGELFGADVGAASDLIRAVYDGFEAWRATLPPGALDTKEVPAEARMLQEVLRGTLNPVHLFFQRFPRLANADTKDFDQVVRWVSSAKDALSNVVDAYRDKTLAAVNESLRLMTDATAEQTTRERFENWRKSLPEHVHDGLSGLSKALVQLPLSRFTDDHAFADALGAIVAEKKPQRWTDNDLVRFRNSFAALIGQIEARALAIDSSELPTQGRNAVARLYSQRIQTLAGNLSHLIGNAGARAQLRDLLKQLEEAEHGDSGRSISQS